MMRPFNIVTDVTLVEEIAAVQLQLRIMRNVTVFGSQFDLDHHKKGEAKWRAVLATLQ
jgi:hypothetical protein